MMTEKPLKRSTTAKPSIKLETQRNRVTAILTLPLFSHLTPETFAALAVKHLCLLHLARGAVLAGIWPAGVVATFSYTAAVQTVTAVLLQVEHAVVDIQQADAAHQACGHGSLLSRTKKKKGRKNSHNCSVNSTFLHKIYQVLIFAIIIAIIVQ